MVWIQLHQSVWGHRKTLALADALDLDETYAAAHLARFWTWALDNTGLDGDITGMSPRVIAIASGWKGDAKAFYEALCATGWIDCDGERRAIHDWEAYGGKLVKSREAAAQRAEASRVKRENVARTVRATDEHGARLREEKRREEKTREEKTREDHPSGGGAGAPEAPAVADAAPVSEPIPKPTPSRRRPRQRAPNEIPIAEARPLTTDAVDEIAARHGRELTDEVVAYWLNDSRFQTQRDKPAFIETKVIQRKGWVPNGGGNGRTNGTQRSPGGRAASGPATVADVERWLATH